MPLLPRQRQHDLPIPNALFQDEPIAAPFQILLIIELDYLGILVDHNVAPIKVAVEKLWNIQSLPSTWDGEDGDEDEEQAELEDGNTEEFEPEFEDFDLDSSWDGEDD